MYNLVRLPSTWTLFLLRRIDDGLIPCPICNVRMKEEDVFAHLDVHNEPEATNGGAAKDDPVKYVNSYCLSC